MIHAPYHTSAIRKRFYGKDERGPLKLSRIRGMMWLSRCVCDLCCFIQVGPSRRPPPGARRRQQLNHLKIIRGVSTMRGLTWNRCRSMVRAGGGAGPLDESLVCWAGGRSACFLGVHTSTGGVPPQRCGLVYCHRYRLRTSGSTTMPVRSAARQARSLEGTLVGKTNAYSMWLSGGASS